MNHLSEIQKLNMLEKIVVNTGLGKLRNQSQFEEKMFPEIVKEFSEMIGQKPSPRQAKKSIAGFKTRTGDIIGLQATLRGKRMHDFFLRMIHMAFPRVKDFRGIDLKNIDEHGNLNVGFREQFVFPEIRIDKSKVNFGIQVTVVPKARSRSRAIDLYRSLGVPLKK